MHRQHRQKRNKRTGDQHREHIAEVRAGRHLDVLEHVGEGAAPLQDALLQHHQAFFQQDDIGRLLGDVHRTVHRNPDIRRAQCRGIVDPVAHKAHHVAVGLEQAHDALLVRRREPGEHVGGFHSHRQIGIAHTLNVIAHQQTLLLQAHLPADFGRNQFVIARKNFYCDPVLGQGFECGCGAFLGRVQESHIANQRQFLLVSQAVSVAPCSH